jgi:hypothetical protein
MILYFFYIMTDICPICIETYSKVQRFKTKCFNCDFEACRKCIRHYVTESSNNEVNCMNCKTTWNDKYISNALLPAFFKKQYRLHTNKNNIDSQLALLPSTQPEVEAIIERKKANLKQIDIQIKIYNLNIELKQFEKTKIKEFIKTIKNNIKTSIINKFNEEKLKPFKNRIKKSEITKMYSLDKQTIKTNASTMYNEYKETDSTYIQIHQKLNEFNTTNYQLTSIISKNNNKPEHKIYNRPCSHPTCNGMLKYNSNLCGICNNITCTKCLQYYNVDNDTTHVCNEDDVKTAKLIKKDTKYCPKCNFGITKISGCDVMFCTQCTTSFNWKTMEILTKNLHNPHYLEYLRKEGTTRDRDNITNNCTANPTITDFDTRRFNNIRHFCDNVQLFKIFTPIITMGSYAIQYILHITDNINTIQTKINNFEDLNRNARIKLLLNEIDRNKFDEIVSKNCYELRFLTQKIQIAATIRDISTELIFNISNNELMAINNSIFNIIDSFNTTFKKISNKSEDFFNNYISITKFTEVMNQLDTIIIEIKKIAKYCIDEDIELSKLYGRSQNYGLRHYLL